MAFRSSEFSFMFDKLKGQEARIYHGKLRDNHAFINLNYSNEYLIALISNH